MQKCRNVEIKTFSTKVLPFGLLTDRILFAFIYKNLLNLEPLELSLKVTKQ